MARSKVVRSGESNSTTGSEQCVRVVAGAAPPDAVVADPQRCRGVELRRLLAAAAADGAAVRIVSGEQAAAIAVAVLAAEVGVATLYTEHPVAVRHAVAMTHSIRGTCPPARVIRGLA